MPPGKEHLVDEGVRAIIELTAERTAERTVAKHEESCAIHAIKVEVWGRDGKGGLDERVTKLEAVERTTIKSRSFWRGALQQAISAIIIAGVTWLFAMFVMHSPKNLDAASKSTTTAR